MYHTLLCVLTSERVSSHQDFGLCLGSAIVIRSVCSIRLMFYRNKNAMSHTFSSSLCRCLWLFFWKLFLSPLNISVFFFFFLLYSSVLFVSSIHWHFSSDRNVRAAIAGNLPLILSPSPPFEIPYMYLYLLNKDDLCCRTHLRISSMCKRINRVHINFNSWCAEPFLFRSLPFLRCRCGRS